MLTMSYISYIWSVRPSSSPKIHLLVEGPEVILGEMNPISGLFFGLILAFLSEIAPPSLPQIF